ncbi:MULTISPECIES: hypothetical protein [Achromobacter]|uniref:Uncharacterized protein n=1 Tax=Alcaligenes xylosoxydans xylosoxydans TaxID=85698 RepID=A0A424W5A6_ALCXX|nr:MULTISPECIES: hypothetical protein [Achromobacter]MBC9907936.1 hypothetical protein [Achromobacter xylosoxidans]MBD0872385.1 hypothetical protein [Achromobacter xylosoxidans]QNP88137.1 hypothetical protein IAG39_11765 [Achromobacter xylosoxidans]RPJ88502.1 hypothetical protein DY367_27640 [Achromobacter xylosoxidans]CAB3661371.1 hypothetical protein LMG26852_03169 [Achromobacter aegrifaciens]
MSFYGVIIAEGNFKRWFRGLLIWVGVVLALLGLRFDLYFLALIGVVIGGVGMYAAKAAMVNVKPFREKGKY